MPFLAYNQSFNAGYHFGMTATQVTGDNLSGYNKAGIYAGGFVNRNITDRAKIQMEMSFIQKGSRKNAKPSDGIYESYLMRLNYVEVPVSYQFDLKKYLSLHAGLSMAYLIISTEKDNYGVVVPDPNLPYFKKIDFDIFAGLTYNINDKWSLLLRYSYSILPIRNTPLFSTTYYNEGQYNDVITTALQYHFAK